MTTKDGASQPDVLTRVLPAMSATSDMPGEGINETIKAPPTSEAGGKPEPVKTEPPAKSDPSKDNSAKTDGEKTGDGDLVKVDGDKADAEPSKKKDGINERFSKLTSDRKAAEAAAAAAEETRKAAEARADKLAKDLETALEAIKKVVPPEPGDERPTRAKFDDPDKYDEALSGWAERMGAKKAKADAEAGFTAQREKESQDAAEAARKADADRINAEWTERSEKAKAEMPDFDEVIANENVTITETMGMAILNSDHGPKIAYHLGKNPAEAARIAALSPARQLLALGALEVTLNAPPKTTTAPDPITPIKGGRANPAPKTPHEESMEEYAARRASELRPAAKGART